ncbi:SSI family serine proteinase inhibitor [Streptomyces diastatochromogenes]|uniref:Serine protease n=1 Tax=Streptomyces diastatochromogenes TaxID=42236 RepID=A0A233S7D7_STRDA|nr:SSI family serine proteinase inhibitor [Streptomyces diastatochromogenes]OXY91553.1 serine protease [Streptomyces diastatochromogenes]
MTYITRATAAAGALLASVGLLAAGPAQAAPRDSLHGNWLDLTVTRGDAQTGYTRGTLLLCDPPLGHPRAAEACTELAAAHGDIARIPAKKVFCPMIFAPVTVHARGQWNGRPVDYQETYSSKCVMNARTGAVFALDG